MVIKINMSILQDSANESNTDKIILTLQATCCMGFQKKNSSFPPHHPTSSGSTSSNLCHSQVQTNAPSAYGRHTGTKSIFSFSPSLSLKSHQTSQQNTSFTLSTVPNYFAVPLNGQYNFKNRETVL